MSFAKLDELCRKLSAYDHALSILFADEATNMPAGGGDARAAALSVLDSERHKLATQPVVADWIEAARNEPLSEDQALALNELARVYRNLICLPTEFVERQTRANLKCEQLWRTARAKADWAGIVPALSDVLSLVREEASRRAEALGVTPYDALMEKYDPGNRAAEITPVFDVLKRFLRDFIPGVVERQKSHLAKHPQREARGPFPIEIQRALGLEMMTALGFDFDHGRLDISHHPFCGGVPADVRMTTRYRTDEFITALMGILHETGHALYEQGLPPEWHHWPLGLARGMAIHESQSLFVERQIALNPSFWEWALPRAKARIPQIAEWSVADLLAHLHHVERSLIRVDADEVTYPLHVILRYELEQELIAGRMQVKDLPEAWDAKMRDYLGLSTLADPANAQMQDVHWHGGSFGYFPSYTLGALIAAQQWRAIGEEMPDIERDFTRGDFSRVNDWRRQKIWRQASRQSTPDLIKSSTGRPLDAQIFISHLRARYAA